MRPNLGPVGRGLASCADACKSAKVNSDASVSPCATTENCAFLVWSVFRSQWPTMQECASCRLHSVVAVSM